MRLSYHAREALSGGIQEAKNEGRHVHSVAGAIDAAARARRGLNDIAVLAESIREKLAGPHPYPVEEADRESTAPEGIADQLHREVRGMSDPLTRIEAALRDIDSRIG